jgi:hypothetical protein
MKNLKMLVLIAFFFLTTGCDKKHRMGIAGVGSNAPAMNLHTTLAGQSNNERQPCANILAYIGGTCSNVAVGNTSLAQWSKGGELYNRIVNDVNAHKGDGPVQVSFYQGEFEGMGNGPGYETWNQRFTQLVRDVRADTGLPSLPFYFYRINEHKYGPYPAQSWEGVRAEQDMVHLQGVKMVVSDGCELYVDELHYTADGYKCLAGRLAEEMGE